MLAAVPHERFAGVGNGLLLLAGRTACSGWEWAATGGLRHSRRERGRELEIAASAERIDGCEGADGCQAWVCIDGRELFQREGQGQRVGWGMGRSRRPGRCRCTEVLRKRDGFKRVKPTERGLAIKMRQLTSARPCIPSGSWLAAVDPAGTSL